jgi:uncharacterized membrane protein YgcG
MACKIKKTEWLILYIVMGGLDFIQFFIIECILVWFFGLGAAINEVADPIIGAIFAGYLFIRKLDPVTHWKSYASVVGMAGLEEITGGAAQLWILDVWYIRRNVLQTEGAGEGQGAQGGAASQNKTRQALYANGRREPGGTASDTRQLNVDGVRLPTKAADAEQPEETGTERSSPYGSQEGPYAGGNGQSSEGSSSSGSSSSFSPSSSGGGSSAGGGGASPGGGGGSSAGGSGGGGGK